MIPNVMWLLVGYSSLLLTRLKALSGKSRRVAKKDIWAKSLA